MTAQDLEALLARKKERYAGQQERKEKLEQTMQNTRNDIEQLEYTLRQLKRAEKPRKCRSRFIPHERIAAFFSHASRVFNRLLLRLNRTLNYTWFCLVLCSRYTIESRTKRTGHRCLTPATVLSYFKRQKEDFVTCLD